MGKVGRPSKAEKAEKAEVKSGCEKLEKLLGKGQFLKQVQTIAKLLEQVPEEAQTIQAILESKVQNKKAGGLLECFPRNYYKMNKLPYAFMVETMALCEPDIPRETWARLCAAPKHDKEEQTAALFFLVMNCTADMDIITIYKRVLALEFQQRYTLSGNRLKGIQFDSATGGVKWAECGHYKLVFDSGNDKPSHIRHIGGTVVAAPTALAAFTGWTVYDNHSLKNAFARCDAGATVALYPCFVPEQVRSVPMEPIDEARIKARLNQHAQKMAELEKEREGKDHLTLDLEAIMDLDCAEQALSPGAGSSPSAGTGSGLARPPLTPPPGQRRKVMVPAELADALG